MPKYELIIRGERGKYTRGDCMVIDLAGDTLDEALKSAELQLVGDRKSWRAGWSDSFNFGPPEQLQLVGAHGKKLRVWLNPDGEVDLSHGVLLEGEEAVQEAWIVEVMGSVNLVKLREEIQKWTLQQYKALEQDSEYQEYVRLKQKFG
jgi:hypothetical protein